MGSIVTRRTAGGEIRYQAHVRRKGHPARVASFGSLTKAKAWIQRTEAAIQEGRHLPQREAQRTSLGAIVDRYMEDEAFANLSAGEQRKRADQLAAWVRVLGETPLSELTPNRIDEARARLRDGRSPSTVNRYLAALSVALSFAVGKGLIQSNPARGGRHGALRRAREPKRDRVLAPDERRRLLDACAAESPALHALVVLALTTGGRQGELLGLRWSQCDLAGERVSFVRTKNGEARSVPLPAAALDVLRPLARVRRLRDDRVLGLAAFPLQAWRRARSAAGLGDVRFHDLRHCYATALADAGASLAELRHALGHKTLAMVLRYAHKTERTTEDAIRERLRGVELA